MTATAPRSRLARRSTALRALAGITASFDRISSLSGRGRGPVRPVERDLGVRVAEVRPEADGVVSLRMVPCDGSVLPRWQPGAHVDVILPSGLTRQYSLCGDPADRSAWQIAVRRVSDGGGGSREVHEAVNAGSRLTLRGPRNAFPFLTVDRYLFVAGGIGITPIRPMLHDAVARGADWSFVYTGRSRRSMPFLDEFAGLDPDRVRIWPDDEYGPPDAQAILETAPHGAALYCCGPAPMIDALRRQATARNAIAESIASLHWERFSPAPVTGGEPFEILLARSGEIVPVAADETALAALQPRRPDLAYSCRQGFCGSCRVPLVDGCVDHRDRCLTETERESAMALCVSRGTGRITVDL